MSSNRTSDPTAIWPANRRFGKHTRRAPWVALLASVLTGGFLASAVAGDDPAAILASTDGDRSIGEKGIELITQFEGVKLDGYLLGDGVCTIGYGHTRAETAGCKDWHITQEEAEAFLAQDVQKYADEVNDYFTRDFNQNQFDALVSFTYNVGAAFKKYGWPKDAPDSYFPGVMIQYTNPPKFKAGLKKRRQAEIALFETPVTGVEEIETVPDEPVINEMIDDEQPLVPQLDPTSPATTTPPLKDSEETSEESGIDLSTIFNNNDDTQAPQEVPAGAFQGGIGAR